MIRRYLLLLLLLFLSSLSQAATGSIPATPSTTNFNWSIGGFSGDLSTVVNSYCVQQAPYGYSSGTNPRGVVSDAINGQFYCQSTAWDGSTANWYVYRNATKGSPIYTCPEGYTLNGQMCDSPDPCAAKAGQSSYGWVTIQIGGATPYGSKCSGGCSQYVTGPVTGPDNPNGEYYTNGKTRTEYAKWQFDGSSCTSGDSAPTASTQPPPRPPKEPVCGANEGVMTTSTGKVHCVPSGTPESSTPKVDKSSETKTFPDGSKLTTDTTKTTDTTTGVTDTKTTSTATEKTGGGAGQAGTPGTTTSGGTSSTGTNGAGVPDGTGNSDFCAKNPGLQICKGGMNEEATQKEVRDELKKMTNPGDTSTDPLKNATHTTESENQLKTENDKFTDAAKGITDPTASSKSSWQQAMESGWFSAIPSSGCTPITGIVGGRQFTIDHCEKASQISDIMSYALWFMLVVGSFVMFTGGQVRTQ